MSSREANQMMQFARLCLNTGHPDEAVKEYLKAIEAYRTGDNREGVSKCAVRILEIRSDHEEARKILEDLGAEHLIEEATGQASAGGKSTSRQPRSSNGSSRSTPARSGSKHSTEGTVGGRVTDEDAPVLGASEDGTAVHEMNLDDLGRLGDQSAAQFMDEALAHLDEIDLPDSSASQGLQEFEIDFDAQEDQEVSEIPSPSASPPKETRQVSKATDRESETTHGPESREGVGEKVSLVKRRREKLLKAKIAQQKKKLSKQIRERQEQDSSQPVSKRSATSPPSKLAPEKGESAASAGRPKKAKKKETRSAHSSASSREVPARPLEVARREVSAPRRPVKVASRKSKRASFQRVGGVARKIASRLRKAAAACFKAPARLGSGMVWAAGSFWKGFCSTLQRIFGRRTRQAIWRGMRRPAVALFGAKRRRQVARGLQWPLRQTREFFRRHEVRLRAERALEALANHFRAALRAAFGRKTRRKVLSGISFPFRKLFGAETRRAVWRAIQATARRFFGKRARDAWFRRGKNLFGKARARVAAFRLRTQRLFFSCIRAISEFSRRVWLAVRKPAERMEWDRLWKSWGSVRERRAVKEEAETASPPTRADQKELQQPKSNETIARFEDPEIGIGLGIIYRELGQYIESARAFEDSFHLSAAIGDLEQALRSARELTRTLFLAARFREVLEWTALALPMSEPGSEEWKCLQYERARALEELGRLRDSLSEYRRVFAGDPLFRDTKGRIFHLEVTEGHDRA